MPEGKKANKEAARIIGRAMLRIAFDHDLDGPYIAADYIIDWAEKNDAPYKIPSRSTIADYFRGKAFPNREFVALFTDALELTQAEQRELSRVFTFPFPVQETLVRETFVGESGRFFGGAALLSA